jgi:glycosyltransferase involved in cell wall biosynthesis
MTPRISVITPSFNQGRFLEQTILSVLDQDYPNLEYIVIDGGSSDDSPEIIQRYQSRLAFWISEADSGQSEAINKGFRRATGDIVTWLNSDDLYLPGALQTAAKYFADPEVSLVHGKTIMFGAGLPDEIRGASETDLQIQYLAKIPFPQPSSFFRRQVLLEYGYLDESLHYMMDYDLLLRIALNHEIKRVDDIFSRYRLHPGCKTLTDQIEQARFAARVFSKLLRSFDFSGDMIKQISDLGLYLDGKDKYEVTKEIKAADLQVAMTYFLESQAHFYYSDLDLETTRRITQFLKEFDPAFYRSHNLNKLLVRSSLLPKNGIKLLRSFRTIH